MSIEFPSEREQLKSRKDWLELFVPELQNKPNLLSGVQTEINDLQAKLLMINLSVKNENYDENIRDKKKK